MSPIAPDTNLIIAITPRRWLTVLQEWRSAPLVITPTVERQVRTRMAKLTERYMRGQFRRHPPPSSKVADAAMLAAKEADLEWWSGERERNDSAYTFVTFSPAEQRAVEHERLRLPARAFSDENHDDMYIVAEAAVLDVPLLVTHNMGSISRETIEEESRRGSCASVTINSPREALVILCTRDATPLETVLRNTFVANAIQADTNASTEHWQDDVDHFLDAWHAFERGIPEDRRLASLASTVFDEATHQEWTEARNAALDRFPLKARASESRYHLLRQDHVRASGYDPW